MKWTPTKVTRFWEFYGSRRHDDFFSERHSHSLASAVLDTARPSRLVDIGCGTGALVLELARRGIGGIGVDGSAAALREAAARSAALHAKPEFRQGPVTALPVGDGESDFATLIELIEHLDDDTLDATLAEARRILSPGGVILITTPNAEDLAAASIECPDCGAEFHVMQHVRRWTATSLEALLETSGFLRSRVRTVRLVENGPLLERLVRSAVYRVRPLRPRLLATARRA